MAASKSGPTLAALNAQIAALQAQADALRKKGGQYHHRQNAREGLGSTLG